MQVEDSYSEDPLEAVGEQAGSSAWSDPIGRQALIVAAMVVQDATLASSAVTTGFAAWAMGAVLITVASRSSIRP